MNAEKNDRRVRHTTMFLKESLIKLMQTYHISKISVKMLCEHADINRSTFYAHYTDQYDLLQHFEQEAIADFNEYINNYLMNEPAGATVNLLKQLLDYTAENSELVMVLISENGDSAFQKDLMAIAQKQLISNLREDKRLNQKTFEYLKGFIIVGTLNILQNWIRNGMVESTQEMAELMSRILLNGLSSFL